MRLGHRITPTAPRHAAPSAACPDNPTKAVPTPGTAFFPPPTGHQRPCRPALRARAVPGALALPGAVPPSVLVALPGALPYVAALLSVELDR